MNQLIKRYGDEKRWVNWSFQEKDGKMTKVPHGSSTDPNTWCVFDAIIDKSKAGIVFTSNRQLLGIDIDHCVSGKSIVHEKKQEIEALLKAADTYTEISPSGEGLHLFLEIQEEEGFTPLVNKKAPFELYTTGRYFTFTGNSQKNKPIRRVSVEEVKDILSVCGYPWGKDKKIEKKTITKTQAVSMEDEDVLQRMFSSKNGEKFKAVYNGDISEYGGDDSSADMAFCSTLAFWTGKDAVQMDRIWMNSPVGAREKTQNRKEYRDRTIENAINGSTEVYSPKVRQTDKVTVITPTAHIVPDDEMEAATVMVTMEQVYGKTELTEMEIDLDLLYTEMGKNRIKVFTLNTENICRVFRKHPSFEKRLRYDLFKQELEIYDGTKWREYEEADTIHLLTEISILFEYFQKVTKGMVFDAVVKVADENKFDSAVDYVKSVKWDGVARLDQWLTHTYGVPDDVYHRAVGSNWMKGLVSRIIRPGCKFDHVLVLEGEQGSKKSTSLAVLGGDWHVETTMSTENKDFFMQFSGKAIIEFSEGETLSRTEVKRMKAIITTQKDKYRPPYERVSKDFPRRCVFAMTTNQYEYLKDETGNRRWLPIKLELPEANVEWLAENRDQLFAETYHRLVVNKESSYEFPKEETREAQSLREVSDPNSERIAEWYFGLDDNAKYIEGITVLDVYTGVFNMNFTSNKMMTKYEEMMVATILKNYLKLINKRVFRNSIRTTRWFSGDTQSSIEEVEGLPDENF